MKTMKAKKYNCHFKGLAITNSPDLPNPDEFNHEESIITAFSFEDALSQWLRKMWDISLSINIPCSLNDEIFNYGETYEEFIASKDIEFNLFKLNENNNRIEIKYKGRNDFYYEISIQEQLEKTTLKEDAKAITQFIKRNSVPLICLSLIIPPIAFFNHAQTEYNSVYASILTNFFPEKNNDGSNCELIGNYGEWGMFYGYKWICKDGSRY